MMMNSHTNNPVLTHSGSCHCGALAYSVKAPADVEILLCNCSVCANSGHQHLIVNDAAFAITSGADHMACYQFGSKTARHYFCPTCGIKPFYIPRSHPGGWSVNFRTLDKRTIRTVTFTAFDGRNWEANIDKIT